jgi:hypothetical protein
MQQDTASMIDGLDFDRIAAPQPSSEPTPLPPSHDEPVIRGFDLDRLDGD